MNHIVCFDNRVAEKLGIEKAVIVFYMYGWLHNNYTNGINIHEGKSWTYNSAEGYSRDLHFSYMNVRKIKRLLSELVSDGYLDKGNYNQTKFDRTGWYTFSDKLISTLQELNIDTPFSYNRNTKNGTIDLPNLDNGRSNFVPTIPIINKQEYIQDISSKENNNKRKVFVVPSLDEVRRFVEEIGGGVVAEDFYDYYESNGWMAGRNKMQDWKAALRRWKRNQYGQRSNTKGTQPGGNTIRFSEIDYGESDI